MARLHLTLLGGFRARLDGDRALAMPIKKAQALLAYLAAPPGQAHPRDKLAALLWGDMREAQARAGLRHVLFTLRKALGDTAALRLDGETVALDPALVVVDAQEFARCAGRETLAELERAAELYGGELLDGLSLREPAFEEWLIAERVRLRELALEALARLLVRHRDAGALEKSVQTALRLVALDPLQEPVHRTLMRLYAQLGRREASLRQYQLCVSALQRELRTEPEEETKALYREILQRRLPRQPAPAAAIPEVTAGDVPPPPSLPSSELPLVGREVELGELRDALQVAWAGRPQLVAVIGEAGVGKSRLVAELALEAARKGGRILVGRCHASEQVLPFGPWVDALRSGGVAEEKQILDKLGPAWRGELARLLQEIPASPAIAPAAGPAQLFEAVAQILERVAVSRPVLLILEDIHWADEMSARLLAFVSRRLERSRLLAVLTVREEELPQATMLRHTLDEIGHEGRLTSHALGPLNRDDTMALARTLVPAADAASVEDALWRASEGNPFMVVETLRALRGRSLPGHHADLPLPERVRSVIADRIERLGERSHRLAAVAAVIGRPFDFSLLERAADLGEADAAEGVEELVRHRVLKGCGEGFEFAHDRIREVLYAQLLPPRRALLHRRVAEALEVFHAGDLEAHSLAVGAHYREGHVWTKAAGFLMMAGTQASVRYAQHDAVVCFEHALSSLAHLADSREKHEQTADVRFRLAHSLYGMGDFARAMECFREAEQVALGLDDRPRLGEIYAGMAYLLGSEGDFTGASQVGVRALTIASSLEDLPLQVWTSIGLVRVYFARGDFARAIERTRWVARAISDAPIDERFGRATLLPSVACRSWLALCLASTGDFREALAWGEDGVRIAEAVGGPHERVWAAYSLARVHLAHGDPEQAIPLLDRALPLCEGRIPLYWPRVIASLGRAFTLKGDLAAGLPLLKRAVDEVRAVKLLFGHPIILMWTAAAHLQGGQLEDAEAAASRSLELSRQHGARGDEAWALSMLGQIATRRGPAGREQAVEYCTQALAIAEELGMAPLQARCHLNLGALHRQYGDTQDARDELTLAIAMLDEMQMSYWRRLAEDLLASLSP